MARKQKLVGIEARNGRWRVFVKVNKKQYSTTFDRDTPEGAPPSRVLLEEMNAWRADAVERFASAAPAAGTFAADIQTYLTRVAAMVTFKERRAHLELWAAALGRDRSRRSISARDIDVVLQRWLSAGDIKPQTVRKRRTSLQSFFETMDRGLKAAPSNPVKATAAPPAGKYENRDMGFANVERVLDGLPESQAKRALTVMAYTGIPPKLLRTVTPKDLDLKAATVHLEARKKGAGTRPVTLPLTVEGRDAFERFAAADMWGDFTNNCLNRVFKRGAKRVGIDPTTVRAYDLRHTFGCEMYRVTKDLATVGRFLAHTPGSPLTQRYAMGANDDVNRVAAEAFSMAAARRRQLAIVTPAATTATRRAVERRRA